MRDGIRRPAECHSRFAGMPAPPTTEGCLPDDELPNRLCAILVDGLEIRELPQEQAQARERDWVRLGRIIDYVGKHYMYRITLTGIARQESLNMCDLQVSV